MREGKRLRERLSYSNVMVTILAVVVLGNGIAMAAGHLGKNSVGPKQLKKNAVTTAKIDKQAITAVKVKNGTLTGKQINASTLGNVSTAETANSLAPTENWHEVGSPGEPAFLNSWGNEPTSPAPTAAFYKDHEGVVHLKGLVSSGTGPIAFLLPAGYRPASGKVLQFAVACPAFCASDVDIATILGPSVDPGEDGAVAIPTSASVNLNGIDFRAES